MEPGTSPCLGWEQTLTPAATFRPPDGTPGVSGGLWAPGYCLCVAVAAPCQHPGVMACREGNPPQGGQLLSGRAGRVGREGRLPWPRLGSEQAAE